MGILATFGKTATKCTFHGGSNMSGETLSFKIVNVNLSLDEIPDVTLAGTEITGKQLFCSEDIGNGTHLGVDRLRLLPGEKFPKHTHPGHHLLYIIKGMGTVTIEDKVYVTVPGDLYLVNGNVLHALSAGETGQLLLSFAVPHKHLSDASRILIVPEKKKKRNRA